jgi:hypothetical protein
MARYEQADSKNIFLYNQPLVLVKFGGHGRGSKMTSVEPETLAPEGATPMTTEDFIIDLFCRVDDRMKNIPNHSQAALWPSRACPASSTATASN